MPSSSSLSPTRSRSDTAAFQRLVHLLRGRRTVVLSGAGVSTESGIPDYRRPDGTRRNPDPMRHREFTGSAEARRRYWARSTIGWPRFRAAQPNDGHRALARLEEAGCVTGIITQNVDRLHQAAGSRRVVDLHGALEDVRCLDCDCLSCRDALQARVHEVNPHFSPASAALPPEAKQGSTCSVDPSAEVRPDGDVNLPEGAWRTFSVPTCTACGGTLMPDVVFFGGCVPEARIEAAWQLYEESEVLLVVGSSLAVYSGYRFALRARRQARPFAVVNLGPTRGADAAVVHLNARLGTILPKLARALTGRARPHGVTVPPER